MSRAIVVTCLVCLATAPAYGGNRVRVVRPDQHPGKYLPQGPKITVVGSATTTLTFAERRMGIRLGRAIAAGGGVVVTGGGPGMPYAAVRGAHGRGGKTVSVAPFATMKEVRRSGDPVRSFSHVWLTKVPAELSALNVRGMNWAYRQVHDTAIADAMVVVPGHGGTIGELGNALAFKRPVAVLELPGAENAKFSRAMRALKDFYRVSSRRPPIEFFRSPEALARWVLAQTNTRGSAR